MNYFNLGIIALTVLTLGLGFLIGFGRGMKRSLLRTIIMVVCFVIAFFCKGFVVNIVKGIEISGKTITELISSSIGEDLASLESNINGLVDGLLNIIVYLLLVLVLHLLTLAIVYPICKIFVKKPPRAKKKRLFGGLIGLGMGLIICICSFAPLTGLVGDVADVATSVFELTETMSESSKAPESNVNPFSATVYADEGKDDSSGGIKDILDKIGVLEFKDSFMGKTYSALGGWYYNIVSSYEVEGKKTNIHTQVGAISGAVKLAGNLATVMKEDFVEKISEGDFSDLTSTMKSLDEIKDNMSDEQLDALSDLLSSTADTLLKEAGVGEELGIDFKTLDLKKVSFETEGKLIEKFSKYADENNQEEIKIDELVDDLSKSTIILPLAANMDFGIELQGEQKDEVLAEINNVTNPEAKEQLKKLFGLSES